MDWHDLDGHSGQFSVAGYNFDGQEWQDVEAGDTPLDDFPESAITDVDRITFHYINEDTGADVYYTVWGPFNDWDHIEDMVDYTLDPYSIA